MSKQLLGAVIRKATISASYRVTVLGQTITRTKDKEWPAGAISAGAALVDLADSLTPEVEDIVGVQVYTPITDADGGNLVDLIFKDGTSIRIDALPEDLAAARDAAKAAILGAL